MPRIAPNGGTHRVTGWRMTTTAAGEIAAPAQLDVDRRWLAAPVPGTVASALREAGAWSEDAPTPLHHLDAWYRTKLTGSGPAILRLHGLATLAEIWLDDRQVLVSDSMFLAHDVPVALDGEHDLAIAFRALLPALEGRRGRARWRPRMIAHQGLRFVRTTLLGHMPGWCPPVHAVGPWRPIELIVGAEMDVDLRAELIGDDGLLHVRLAGAGADGGARVAIAGVEAALVRQADGTLRATARVPRVAPWWPHTHGEPTLHDVTAIVAGEPLSLGRVGFRRIEVERGAEGDGFALRVNGVPVFCRGACWSSADLVALPCDRAAYARWLDLARDAGMNMLRVGGTMIYESNEFFSWCDENGVMVWQDVMLANFDYPEADPAWVEAVTCEVGQLLDRTQGSPSLAVVCGGSEVAQQAAMMGLPAARRSSRLVDEILPATVTERRPDVVWVPGSPSGGAVPFVADQGITHYYGVGAYQRPLEDARRAGVRFASECLAFANVPDALTVGDLGVPALHHPRWKERVPRDAGASWDFEDVRDHYLQRLHGADPARLRYEDPDRYLELSRAVTGEVIEAVIGEWRSTGSTCGGALLWLLQDLWPGAGWGLVDAHGRPKAAWHALRRACRPVQVILTDEGVNGLAVHLVNETAETVRARLTLTVLRDGSATVLQVERDLELPPRSTRRLDAAALAGAFFDFTYAYRFGPPAHDVTVVTLTGTGSAGLIAETFHFPQGAAGCPDDSGLTARLGSDDDGWSVILRSERLARAVHLEDDAFRAADEWFHLPPGVDRTIRLIRREDGDARPSGVIRALNARRPVPLRSPS